MDHKEDWVPAPVAHLSADGTAALVGACVDVEVEEDTGFRHFKVGVSIHSSFQPLEAPEHHKSMPGTRRQGVTDFEAPLGTVPKPIYSRAQSLPQAPPHLKLGSWAEAMLEPRSDVPMVRSYPSWKGASANTAPGGGGRSVGCCSWLPR